MEGKLSEIPYRKTAETDPETGQPGLMRRVMTEREVRERLEENLANTGESIRRRQQESLRAMNGHAPIPVSK